MDDSRLSRLALVIEKPRTAALRQPCNLNVTNNVISALSAPPQCPFSPPKQVRDVDDTPFDWAVTSVATENAAALRSHRWIRGPTSGGDFWKNNE